MQRDRNGDMYPDRFRQWAEDVFRQSPAIAGVEAVQLDPPNGHITHTHVTFATGARIVVHWIGGAPLATDAPRIDEIVTGPPPEPVKVPDLPTSGRLKVADIEAHLVALVNNSGHEQVKQVLASSQQPTIYTAGPSYAIRVCCHSGHTVTGYFCQILGPGERLRRESEVTDHPRRKEV